MDPPTTQTRTTGSRLVRWRLAGEARSAAGPVAGLSLRARRAVVGLGLALLLLGTLARAYVVYAGYVALRERLPALEALANRDPATLTASDLARAATDVGAMNGDLRRLDAALTLPLGADRVVAHVPEIGPRYASGLNLLRLGIALTDAGERGARVGSDALTAFSVNGLVADSPPSTPTWLDVVAQNRNDVARAMSDVNQARALRGQIDDGVLPASIRAKLGSLDDALAKLPKDDLSPADLSAVLSGLGADRPVRYLVLFQNPAELRPSGGFPGTMALVTIERGQLRGYEIFDGHRLTDDYIRERTSIVAQPWPIQTYFPQEGLLLHDAGWWADFPRSGAQITAMYAQTNWPKIDGVIAIQPTVVADLVKVTGPLDVEIDGELRHVTPDNVYDEIERQRRLIVEGIKPWDKTRFVHKEAVAEIGTAIMKNLRNADRSQMKAGLKSLIGAADARDIQVYAADPAIERLLDERRWTGRLAPDPLAPSVAVTFANVALGKSSENMVPSLSFRFGPIVNGRRVVELTIGVVNNGPTDVDPLYSGFQRWWIDLTLPAGFERLSSSVAPMPDPESPRGGSYIVDVFPQQAGHATVVFSMPADDSFLLRRQPGLTDATVSAIAGSCPASQYFTLARDQVIDVASRCGS